jgi:acetoin utilization deacetylase AcuC-like enzyme
VKVVYSDGYFLNLGDHVFPAVKYGLIKERLLTDGVISAADLVAPQPASRDDLLLVHAPGYLLKLKTCDFTFVERMLLEIPLSRPVVDAFYLATGGSILAARLALEDRVAVNLGGGFHHAFRDRGEGFCLVHDVAVAIEKLRQEKRLTRALVVDCDVHQGNGTAGIFRWDEDVFTLSIHQLNNYPTPKPPSRIDIDLADGVEDAEYLIKLERGLTQALGAFSPELLCYIAGADPYKEDQLGGLSLTHDGLARRDALVLQKAQDHDVPVMVTLAGGYARRVEDTVAIHATTVRIARDSWEARSARSVAPGHD